MKKGFNKNYSGYTLFELILAMAVSSVLVGVIAAMFQPAAVAFSAVVGGGDTRLQVAAPLSSLEQDAATQRAVYVDPAQCYALCMVDGNSQRTYYYWDQSAVGNVKNLYRKREGVNNPIACTGGKVFARGLDSANTSFAVARDILTVKMSAPANASNAAYTINTAIFPSIQERQVILSEGFECGTLRQGWTVVAAGQVAWNIATGSSLGNYQIAAFDNSAGASTTSIEIGIDLSRVSKATLSFSYMNSGNIGSGDTFMAELWDGTTWRQAYSDTTGSFYASPRAVNADLSGFALGQANKIRFSGTLNRAASNWYVDGISVYNP